MKNKTKKKNKLTLEKKKKRNKRSSIKIFLKFELLFTFILYNLKVAQKFVIITVTYIPNLSTLFLILVNKKMMQSSVFSTHKETQLIPFIIITHFVRITFLAPFFFHCKSSFIFVSVRFFFSGELYEWYKQVQIFT